jgi:uncharacterized membrane protein YccC
MDAFNARNLGFATKTSAAAIAAILLALWFDLPNPGWAGMTVFLTSQQLGAATGAVVSRAVYRSLGTLLGVAGMLIVIPAFIAAPELLIAGIAGWVALCLYVSLLDRSPRSYVFLLAGYTLPLVGMPLANNPSGLFDLSQWRAEEIALGATLSMAVHSVFAPSSVRPLLTAKARAVVAEARCWILQGLGPQPTDEAERRARERLGADLAELSTLAIHLRFEPGITQQDIATVSALEEQLLALLPLLAGVEERLSSIRVVDERLAAQVDAHLEAVRLHLETTLTRANAAEVSASGKSLVDAAQPELTCGQLLTIGAMDRLGELLDAWSECLTLSSHLEDPSLVPDDVIRRLPVGAHARTLHIDRKLAASSGFAAALAVGVAGALCWALGWDQGGPSIGLAAMCSSMFAYLDDPRPVLKVTVLAIVLAAPAAALYVFAVFPALDGHVGLALALAPFFFMSALYMATPKLGLPAFGLVLNAISLMSIQPVQNGDFMSFTASSIGLVLGATIALVVTSLVRVISVETSVRRILRASWSDLAALAEDRGSLSRTAWTSRMMDRVGLLLPRLAGTSAVLRARAERALDDLRLGANMLDLRDAGIATEPHARATIESALAQIGAHLRQRLKRPDISPDGAILRTIDRAIAALLESDPGLLRVQGLTAATGLRLGLFPAKPDATNGAAQ